MKACTYVVLLQSIILTFDRVGGQNYSSLCHVAVKIGILELQGWTRGMDSGSNYAMTSLLVACP